MLCCVNDCGREAHYKQAGLCQLHYHRQRRNGTTELVQRPRKLFYVNDCGYESRYEPAHPLANKSGTVYVNRAVLYDKIGPGPMECALCGVGLTWKTCRADHIDEDVRNNSPENIRPLCNRCNTWRSMPAPAEWNRTHVIEFEGVRLTPAEWARDPRVKVCGRQIVLRKLRGMSDAEALFGAKRTHNGKKRIQVGAPKPHRKLTIDGVARTLADWARQAGVNVTGVAISSRLAKGWSPREAVYLPPRNQHRAKRKALEAA